MTTENRSSTGLNPVLFIGSDMVGRGENHELGRLLMQRFLHEVGGHGRKPDTVVLMNNGVKLVTRESAALPELQQLEAQGVDILACGTCLDRLQLLDRVAVGKVSNMPDITDTLLKSSNVISL
jgi:selenium metabolism protein YedF